LLCSDYSRPEEAQLKLNDLIRIDNTFNVDMVEEAQGDIWLKLNKDKNVHRALKHYNKSYQIQPDNFILLLKLGKCYD
jgi:predicted negative regulator of RcsB-dependent stress response